MNQADVSVGIPAMVNCLILVPFSVFFHYAYDVGPYMLDTNDRSKSVPEHGEPAAPYQQEHYYQGGVLGIRAFLGMLNPGEILGAIALMFKILRCGGRRRRTTNATVGRGYDTVTSTEGRDRHELGRRDRRRMDKHGASDHSGRYDQRGAESAPYGWTTPQNGNGQYQQGYR